MTTNPTPDPITAEIAELVPLMEKAGIMPRSIGDRAEDCDHSFYYDCDMGYGRCGIDDKDLLHILRGTAEDWLRGRGWYHLNRPDGTHIYNFPSKNGMTYGGDSVHAMGSLGYKSLPAALAAEIEKGVG